MIREAIDILVRRQDLTQQEASSVMTDIWDGMATPAQIGAFLIALRMKGETAEEIAGMARVMRDKALQVKAGEPLVDTCGTGGDASGTFNISTTAAFVVAGAGVKVAKHGNRAASSACGSADVLEALGVKIALSPQGVELCLKNAGIGFMFAPTYHPAMRYAAIPRKEIGIRTVFNILGPLTNPAHAEHQVIGVADASIGEKMARVLALMGSKHALVVHGEDGLDELTLGGKTQVWELNKGQVKSYTITPEDADLKRAEKVSIIGGSAQASANILKGVLSGQNGPARDVVLLNAAAALVAADKAATLKDGVAMAAKAIESGAATSRLNELVKVSQSVE